MTGNLAYQELYEESWEELINGKIVAMSPRPTINHYQVARNITRIFEDYLKKKPCRPFGDGVDLYLTEKERFIPDSMVVCNRDIIKHDGIHGAPDLVVEVLSPGSEKLDKGYKKGIYERFGVREYWIVSPYPAHMGVEVYRLQEGKFILDNIYRFYPDYQRKELDEEELAQLVDAFPCGIFDGLFIPLADVFYRVI